MTSENIPAPIRQSLIFDEDGADNLVSVIRNLSNVNSALCKNTIISICGGSCTGKSTQVASSLRSKLGDEAQVLAQDNYMFAAVDSTLDPVYRWDHPDLYNVSESAYVMEQLRYNRICKMPQPSTQRQAAVRIDVYPTRIILIEGLYTAFNSLSDYADFVIYVEMPLYARIIRRLIRNMYERYRNLSPLLIVESFLDSPLKAHQDFVVLQRNKANVIFTPKYFFKETIVRFSLKPIANAVPSTKFIERYQFTVAEDLFFEIYKYTDGYYFRLVYNGLIYLNFRIHEALFYKLLVLDMDAV